MRLHYLNLLDQGSVKIDGDKICVKNRKHDDKFYSYFLYCFIDKSVNEKTLT